MSDDALPSWSELLALVQHLEGTDFEDFVVEMPGLTVRVSRHGLIDAAAAATATEHNVESTTIVDAAITAGPPASAASRGAGDPPGGRGDYRSDRWGVLSQACAGPTAVRCSRS